VSELSLEMIENGENLRIIYGYPNFPENWNKDKFEISLINFIQNSKER
jgi:hypothetical protein